jgi:hypothetical protein
MRDVVDTDHERDLAVSDYERMGWEIDTEGENRTVLKRGFRGSWWWHLLFLILAPIVGNLCYSAYRRFDRPEKTVVRVRDGARKE